MRRGPGHDTKELQNAYYVTRATWHVSVGFYRMRWVSDLVFQDGEKWTHSRPGGITREALG